MRELWDRPLYAPGPNGGLTGGDDLEVGGKGLMFVVAPERLALRHVASALIERDSEPEEVRALQPA